MAEKLCQLKKKGGSGGGAGGSIPGYSVTSYSRNNTIEQSFSCEIGDIIIVGCNSSNPPQHSWNPTIVSGATLIQEQTGTFSGSTRRTGLIAVATAATVTIRWYGAGTTGIIKVIHTDKLRSSTYTIEKNCTASLSTKNIVDLKVGDLIVGNAGSSASAANSIKLVVNGAPFDSKPYYCQAYIVTKDNVNVVLNGDSVSYTIVAFRQ